MVWPFEVCVKYSKKKDIFVNHFHPFLMCIFRIVKRQSEVNHFMQWKANPFARHALESTLMNKYIAWYTKFECELRKEKRNLSTNDATRKQKKMHTTFKRIALIRKTCIWYGHRYMQPTHTYTLTYTRIHTHTYTHTRHHITLHHTIHYTTLHTWCCKNVYALALEFFFSFSTLKNINVKLSTVWLMPLWTIIYLPPPYIFFSNQT